MVWKIFLKILGRRIFFSTSYLQASLASKNCNKELAKALKSHIKVIPIILEHCDWQHHQLSDFEVLPLKGKPITKWDDSERRLAKCGGRYPKSY